MKTNTAIATAEDAYMHSLDNHLYSICDFDEADHLPEDYHIFERYIMESEIDAEMIPFSQHQNFYLFGNPHLLQLIKEELDAYFNAFDSIAYAHICEDQRIYFLSFQGLTTKNQGIEILLNGFAYVMYCINAEEEILNGVPF